MQPNTLHTKPLLKSLGIDSGDSMKNEVFLQLFTVHVSDEQMLALARAVKFGWKVSKLVYSRKGDDGCAIAMYADKTTAWMLPNGKIERAKVGQKNASLNPKWTETT